ncbi:MAG: HisA/HisF-related TIM barrel protein, partial [Fervidicoccaceae archaeon]
MQPVKRVIPCLDVLHGRVVKGVRFGDLKPVGEPSELAAAYESQGADELALLDVSASLEGRLALLDVVERTRD